jgi:hypothetical protein
MNIENPRYGLGGSNPKTGNHASRWSRIGVQQVIASSFGHSHYF